MTEEKFTTSFLVAKSPAEVFAAILDVRGWWSRNIHGATDRVGATFDYAYKDLHRCTIRVDELVPGKKVAWTVVENTFSFTRDPEEWNNTGMVFDIAAQGGETEVVFTHIGLVPAMECYPACSDGWRTYINGSLKNLIAIGEGSPNQGEAMTGSEQALSQ